MDQQKVVYPKTLIKEPSFFIVGLQRNIHQKEELDQQTAQISKTFREYYDNQLYNKIQHRVHPHRTYCAYYDHQGDPRNCQNWQDDRYKMLLGEVVSEVGELPEGFSSIEVPASSFCKFNVGPGPIPKVVIDAWISLSSLPPEEFGGERTYFDLEVYPETNQDKENMILDIYIGINKKQE